MKTFFGNTQLAVLTLTLFLTSECFGLQVQPFEINGAEGDQFSITLTIESNDWTNNTSPECSDFGFEFAFAYAEVNVDAVWGQDLELSLDGNLPSEVQTNTFLFCSTTQQPLSFSFGVVGLITDTTLESTEIAALEFSTCNFDGEYFCSSSNTLEIFISDPPLEASVVNIDDAAEPSTNGTFRVSLDQNAPDGGVTINYSVAGTATEGVDYQDLPGSVFIPASTSSADVTVEVIDNDTEEETTETVVLSLVSGDTYTVNASQRTATLEIIEDVPPAVVGIEKVNDASEPDTDGVFRVFADRFVRGEDLRVFYTVSGTANAGEDYQTLEGSVLIRDKRSSALVTIVVENNDGTAEGTETVVLALSPRTEYEIDPDFEMASLDIIDDGGGTIAISTEQDASEPATPGRFAITFSEPLESAVTVNYSVSGDAIAGTDYVPFSGPMTIPAGATGSSQQITVIDDDATDGDKTIRVTMTPPAGFALTGEAFTDIMVFDDDMAGILVSPSSGLVTDEGGASATFTVVLKSQPTAPVNITVLSSDPGEGTVSPASLTFTAANWDTPQTVTVTGVPDDAGDGDAPYTVNLAASSSDPGYQSASAAVSVTNLDNPPGMVAFVMPTYDVDESDGAASIAIKRVGGALGAISATFQTVDNAPGNTAVAGEDYTSTTATVDWADGDDAVKTVQVPVFENVDKLTSAPESVLLMVEADGMEPETAVLNIASNAIQDITDAVLESPLQPNQRSVAEVIVDTCPQGNNEPDFQALCTAMVVAAIDGESLVEALGETTPDNAAAVRSSGQQTSNVQVSAVDGRLGTLRGGGGAGFSASGFGVGFGDAMVSGDLIRSFISAFDQNTPAFMQRYASQNANSSAFMQNTTGQFANTPVSMQSNAGQSADSGFLDEFGRWGAWISGRIIFGEKDPSTNQVDYDFDTAGITFGLDYRFTEKFVAGIAVGYANTDVDLGSNDGALDTDGYTISLYATYFQSDRFYLGGSIGFGSNDYDQTRNVRYVLQDPGAIPLPDSAFNVDQTMNASYDGTQVSFALDGGWDFNHGSWTFGPTFRVNYVDVDVDAYTENLVKSNQANATTGWAVRINDQKYKSLQPSIGFEFSNAVSRDWGVFIPQGYVEAVSELKDGDTVVTGQFLGNANNNSPNSTFSLLTDDFEETFARAGLGFGLILKNNKSAFLMFDADLGRDLLSTYYINAGFRWQF
jgi:outer membrane autotransporter protein